MTTEVNGNQDGYSNASQMASAGLTVREKEVLLAVAAGASNNDIAEKFYISTHTAKNHIYNIYRKIKVKTRLEAILWVTNYL
jgi:DNA-binding CsgD family transcriptional regulator